MATVRKMAAEGCMRSCYSIPVIFTSTDNRFNDTAKRGLLPKSAISRPDLRWSSGFCGSEEAVPCSLIHVGKITDCRLVTEHNSGSSTDG